jgi:protein-arginine kinase activator protein McsA
MPKFACECTDPGCPHCKGNCKKRATQCLRRVDMEDKTGTLMCNKCADDALDSGLFNSDTAAFIRATTKRKR